MFIVFNRIRVASSVNEVYVTLNERCGWYRGSEQGWIGRA